MNYLEAIARQIEAELSVELRPWANADALYRSYALLTLVAGREVTMENVHDAWSSWKCSTDPENASLRPFAELDPETREKDRPYVEAIRRVASRLIGH
ncbi:UNVERIFIED_ORG: hypothetical protein J2X79_003773 [Arthrobacter globiformis]|nr:hypothetical protein [Arthrobacter globiformis]